MTTETPEEYAARMQQEMAVMALPVGAPPALGGVGLRSYDYAKFAAELAPYRPRRYRAEIWPAIAAAANGSDYIWMVTAELTEQEYLERIYRPWRDRVKRGEH